jgi:hypothetical protein
LKWLIRNDKTIIGFGSSNYVDLYQKFKEFLNMNWAPRVFDSENAGTLEPLKKWNFMKVDLKKCFDSINIDEVAVYLNSLFKQNLGYNNVITLMRNCLVYLDIDNKQLRNRYDHFALCHGLNEKGFSNGIADYITQLDESIKDRKKQSVSIHVPISIYSRNLNTFKLSKSLNKCLYHVLIKVNDEIYERMNG